MRVPDHWGIIGFPISHSLTPRLFEIVGKYVGIEGSNNLSIETQNIEDFITNSLPILNEYDEEATIWLSCTTPMKHEIRFLCDHILSIRRHSDWWWRRRCWRGKRCLRSCRRGSRDPGLLTVLRPLLRWCR